MHNNNNIFKSLTPAVCIDVDGVIKRGSLPIPSALPSIIKLRKYNIPLSILTNGGGDTEQSRAHQYSKLLNLPRQHRLTPSEIILCHSPMKDALLKYKHRNQLLLISGTGNISNVLLNYGFRNFITTDEYTRMFPEIFPFFYNFSFSKSSIQRTKDIVSKRIGRPITSFPPIAAIVQLNDLVKWEINSQLFSDILISPNGVPGKVLNADEPQKVEYHLACLDMLYMDKFPIPRYACGAFFVCLENLVKMRYGRRIKYIEYGKPSTVLFDYARRQLIKNNAHRNINKFYMIGDNPDVDIRGANCSGFHSILVKTGIFKGKNNSMKFPARTVCNDIGEAVDFIIENEKHNLL